MSRSCTICNDPRRPGIDHLLAAGRSGRSLAADFGLPPESLKRHARSHVATPVAVSADPVAGGTDPLAELVDALRVRALDGRNSGTTREYRLALAALTERSAERPAYNILADPGWLTYRTRLLRALEPYPEARLAAAEALRDGPE